MGEHISPKKHYGQNILPGFNTVLRAISKAWKEQRTDLESNGEQLTLAVTNIAKQQNESSRSNLNTSDNDYELLTDCASKILPLFDLNWGGFRGAPKFPQSLCLQICLQAAAKLKKQKDDKSANPLLEALYISLDRMAEGGIYDHLAGGFARYSTDDKWLVPHFEKMLYDNALLAEIYLDAFSFAKEDRWKNTACETLDFIARELISDEGGFYSSLDADSEGSEGKFYVWEKSEIEKILGPDSQSFCQFFGITEKGNFETNKNILHIVQNGKIETSKIKEIESQTACPSHTKSPSYKRRKNSH